LKSIQIDRYGGPEVLLRREIAIPVPQADEILIRISHAGINFMDIHTRQGNAVGKTTLRDSFRAAARSGLIVNYGAVSGALSDLDPLELGEAGSLFLTRPRLADHLVDAAMIQRRADAIFAALLDGTLRIEIAGRYNLENVDQAHADLKERRMTGKPVLVMEDSSR